MGNKLAIADWIIPLFPPHKAYIEVFGGTASILLNKPRSKIEFYNDLNPHLSNLFEVIRTNKDGFLEQIKQMPMDEYRYVQFYNNHHDYSKGTSLENAVRYFYIMSLCFMGKYDGGFKWDYSEIYKYTLEKKERTISQIQDRLKHVVILNKTAFKVIEQLGKKKDSLLYLDPPYVGTEGYYEFLAGNWDETDHTKLRDALGKINGNFFLSYENDELINDLYGRDFYFLHKKKHRSGQASQKSGGGLGYAEEIVVTNYQEPNTLFSYEQMGEVKTKDVYRKK